MLTNNQLKTYLNIFKDDTITFFEYTNGYVRYNEVVRNFISDCYKSDMMDTDYLTNLKKYLDENVNLSELIESANIDLLKSILTFYIRGERFCEGMIANSFKEKVFKRILSRLVFLENSKY